MAERRRFFYKSSAASLTSGLMVLLLYVLPSERSISALWLVGLDGMLTIMGSLLFPCFSLILRKYRFELFTWNFVNFFFRELLLGPLLPRRINLISIIFCLIVWQCGAWFVALSFLEVIRKPRNDTNMEFPKIIVKEIVGSVRRFSNSSVEIPTGDCCICLQNLFPSKTQRILSLTRLRPRINTSAPKEFGASEILQTCCGHFFHTDCISKWVKVTVEISRCPMCKCPISK